MVLLALLFHDREFSAPAFGQLQPTIGGGGGVFVMPAQLSRDVFGCYLLDIDAQTLCVYRYDPGPSLLKLAAARSYRYDRKLGNFNVSSPTPAEVKDLLDQEARGARSVAPAEPIVPDAATRPIGKSIEGRP
jgi:hypothetical protein